VEITPPTDILGIVPRRAELRSKHNKKNMRGNRVRRPFFMEFLRVSVLYWSATRLSLPSCRLSCEVLGFDCSENGKSLAAFWFSSAQHFECLGQGLRLWAHFYSFKVNVHSDS